MSVAAERPAAETDTSGALRDIEGRVLWLATAIVHEANLVRPDGLKVGGHQASSASMVSIMTSLWFRHLRQQDRVSVKPHASPVLHAVNYLLGELDEKYLPTLSTRCRTPNTSDSCAVLRPNCANGCRAGARQRPR
ncbi:MAG TPA: hypothetical protein VIX15_12195 [Streptosporangiaceae bacterium]